MSVTCFPEKQINIGVMYGCTPSVMSYARIFLRSLEGVAGQTAFHPMILPMVYAELERKRLLNVLEDNTTQLEQRILDIEKKLRRRGKDRYEKGAPHSNPTARDCETTRLWVGASSLKNGLESLKAQFVSMSEHCHKLYYWQSSGERDFPRIDQEASDRIKNRLLEMSEELNTKVRHCEGVLGGTLLAGQLGCLADKFVI